VIINEEQNHHAVARENISTLGFLMHCEEGEGERYGQLILS